MTKQFQYKKQQFQSDAVAAVCDSFMGVNLHTPNYFAAFKEQISANIQAVQNKNKLKPQQNLTGDYPLLDIQMETGTGKTFVFINTVFELHKHYGLTHFVIVVPSIAIKEGVKGTFTSTQDYFFDEYGARVNVLEYKTDRKTKGSINSALFNFVQSDGLSVLITTTQTLDKDGENVSNVIYKKLESSLFDKYRTAADAIASKKPVFIIDEAHGNVTEGSVALNLINQRLSPILMLRYSATFALAQIKNLVYVLDSYDAFKQKLVKKIGVREYQLSHYVSGSVYLKSMGLSKKNDVVAVAEVVNHNGELIEVKLDKCEDVNTSKASVLFTKTKNEIYRKYYVSKIDLTHNKLSFSNGVEVTLQDSSIGKIFEDSMIRDTLRMHFKKESYLFSKNIKCLSLFFIDSVSDYRNFDVSGERGYLQEKFEQIYAEELANILASSVIPEDYKNYLRQFAVGQVHGGYFAADKKSNEALSANNDTTKLAQEEIYKLIMQDKARVLQLENPLRFIFAHSAIREGWDNPNVFQICQLRNIKNETSKIQSIGRGLRLCVDANLQRMDSEILGEQVFDTNNLSVFVFSDNKFVESLQSELRGRISGFRQAVASFSSDLIQTTFGVTPIKASKIFAQCFDDNENLLALEELQQIFERNNLDFALIIASLTTDVNTQVERIGEDSFILQQPRKYRVNLDNYQHFIKLWDLLHQDVYFTVHYSADYIEQIVTKLNQFLQINPVYINKTSADIMVNDTDFVVTSHDLPSRQQVEVVKFNKSVNQFIDELCIKVKLSRRVVVQILQAIKPEKFASIKNNPDLALEQISQIINQVIYQNILDNVTYQAVADSTKKRASWVDISSQEFTAKHFIELLDLPEYAGNCLFEEISPYDSLNPERAISEQSLQNKQITVFAKLPKKIKIPSPIEPNGVNPDFAFVIKRQTKEDVYFVAEAKPSTLDDNLRGQEQRKIAILAKYFAACGAKVEFEVVTSVNDVATKLNQILDK